MVMEFGRQFKGEIGFLDVPEWRKDLKWLAERAEEDVNQERARCGGLKRDQQEIHQSLTVRCVLLTKGGEQA